MKSTSYYTLVFLVYIFIKYVFFWSFLIHYLILIGIILKFSTEHSLINYVYSLLKFFYLMLFVLNGSFVSNQLSLLILLHVIYNSFSREVFSFEIELLSCHSIITSQIDHNVYFHNSLHINLIFIYMHVCACVNM